MLTLYCLFLFFFSISTKSPLKSKRKVGNFKTPMKTPMTLKNNATKSTTKPQPVPDFSKLHRKWTESFERGKACKKKPCTMVCMPHF